jgi:putative ABC transport system permease protein
MLLRIAWRDLRQKPLQHCLTALVTAAAVGLSLAVMLTASSVRQGMVDASMPFDMIVGAKGSPTQLIFNTIFLQDTPVGNIPHDLYRELATDQRVAEAIPFAFGDSYRGFRIVGSTADIFQLRPAPKEPPIFRLAQGRFFAEEHEAVLGAAAAGKLNLGIGGTFKASHGVMRIAEEHEHAEDYTVVGILEPMHRPYDVGIFTPIETVWEVHDNKSRDVTAAMVKPKDYVGLMQMYQEINTGEAAQAAFPGAVMADVFAMLGRSEEVMTVIAAIVLAMALITILISLYWSVLSRNRENAILRAIGAGRQDILKVIVIENAIVILASIILGMIIGHLVAYGVSAYMQTMTAVYAPVGFMIEEVAVVVVVALLGITVSLLPALNAYRGDVAGDLLPR